MEEWALVDPVPSGANAMGDDVIKVAVFGANGRMGTEVCRAVQRVQGLQLVAAVDAGDPHDEAEGCDVVVDFTHPDAVMENIKWCIDHDVHSVVGTTGFTQERIEQVREWLATKPELGCVIASNFSIGAVLMMHFAELAAGYYPSVEVIELHHTDKADAPSGTAGSTVERIAAARERAELGEVPDATVQDPEGARGAVVDGIHVHSVRLQGLTAHQEVLFGAPGETLTIRHDSTDRTSFMPGVVKAVQDVPEHPGLTLGIERILGIE